MRSTPKPCQLEMSGNLSEDLSGMSEVPEISYMSGNLSENPIGNVGSVGNIGYDGEKR
ncbi:MAG: hypothetical protein EBE86_030465 [Hormoscilla sp. GUM202]|nr:hypothetical protein [Hormoscilla sp. GUM202]